MDSPLCISQDFVNKQNIRSYRNIFSSNLHKSDTLFLQQIFLNDDTVTALSSDFLTILLDLKEKLKIEARTDFRNNFPEKCHSKNEMVPVSKAVIYESCWKALYNIIPRNFFGNCTNTKTFQDLIKKSIYSMRGEHVMLSNYLNRWNLTVPPWKKLPENKSKDILYKISMWILKNILSTMICLNFYVTTCKLDVDEHKLYYFWKNHWQSFYDKKISDMIFTKILKKSDIHSFGKKMRRHRSNGEKLQLKILKRTIPKLHLVLKSNGNFRPIVSYKYDSTNFAEKYRVKERLKFLKALTIVQEKRIELLYNKLYNQWKDLNRPKLYFVKTDLTNAFGSINKEKLIKILMCRHMHFQKSEKDISTKRKYAQLCKDMVTELRKPILVRAGSTVYEWHEGLVQGYKYSPALSELYYSYMDSQYFANHMEKSKELKLFVRVVDDYLYITDSLQDAQNFLEALSNYRNVNYNKTVTNFEHTSAMTVSDEINFLGYSYDTSNLQVSRSTNVFFGQMCYKILFSKAISNIYTFIENRIGQSAIQINGHIFNFNHNSETTVWSHIFMTFCLSANKFCTILSIVGIGSDLLNHIVFYKKLISVKLSNVMLETLLKNKPANFKFLYCINHFRYLSFLALLLCAKNTPKCDGLIQSIKIELAKCNCIFGKWKDHASTINRDGTVSREAIKDICRRTDLRIIMRKFESLPIDFQCYNEKKLHK